MEAVKGSFVHYYIEQGKAEGKAEGIELAAKNMRSLGVDTNIISKTTELSIEKIQNL
ncbi:hypothetical protein [Rickettsia endosymbiont of Cardiosporidium cionae]|uniref:hypothetical protein n=1 Tax=Rickettsia endosymbiont of Cardiosporidium cionae TaxID=2777155 RepID=UPI001893E846|nr:hypothetical protein [Rickettsia endosymbiont of Cardiosporidium cionae]KAF8818017.1 hypothetical protein IHI24_000925 [Rickettsia endosymbiont of Cardiosporidium cionae]